MKIIYTIARRIKTNKQKTTEETTNQKQVMDLGVECWVACVGLKVNFWCSGHSIDPPSSSCNLKTNKRQIGNLHLEKCISQQDLRVRTCYSGQCN